MQRGKLSQAELTRLSEYGLENEALGAATLVLCAAGEWLLRAGDPIDALYFVLNGRAKVCTDAENGKRLLLSYYVSRGVIGDLELMTNSAEACSSVQAVTPLRLAVLPMVNCIPLLNENARFLRCIGEGLAEKLKSSAENSSFLILHSIEARLCAYLAQMEAGGFFAEPLTETAELLGVSYRHLLRCLKRLTQEGVLEKTTRGYRVLNESALHSRARL